MRHTFPSTALSLVLAGVLAGAAHGATILQPGEATSEDVFVYEFGVPGAFRIATAARVTNLDSQTLNALSPPTRRTLREFPGQQQHRTADRRPG